MFKIILMKFKNYWNKKPTYQKGAIIGALLGIIISILPGIISSLFPYSPYDIPFKINTIAQILNQPVYFLLAKPLELTSMTTGSEILFTIAALLLVTSTIISFAIYGAIIGWTYEKIKQKNKC